MIEIVRSFGLLPVAIAQKAEAKFDKFANDRAKRQKEDFEKKKFKLVPIPIGWRPKRNHISNSKVPTIKVKPAGNQKRISPALRRHGLVDQEKIPINPRVDARDLPANSCAPWDPRKPYWEDEPVEVEASDFQFVYQLSQSEKPN